MFETGNNIKQAAVAGSFYPEQAEQLQGMFAEWMNHNQTNRTDIPRALIVPHAGYIYSGETAAKGFALWRDAMGPIKTIVVIGPAHRVPFNGMTTIDHDAVATPLGSLNIDTDLREHLLEQFDFLKVFNAAQAQEHSLEVEFPFIKHLLPKVKVLPLLNGRIDPHAVRQVFEALWHQEGVYFVISSDLSHFHDYATANFIDNETAQMIQLGQWQSLSGERACGYKGIQGLLAWAESYPLHIEPIERINSGDTAGDKHRVVGYGTWAFYEEKVQCV
ncbi:AmmeMemoRadiSam system protein B [Thiomicrorhabdus sp. zzn3]|uniref:AmmeMemoRadiSam system protein B n=1 Tax=Thiomicrorhabdus sp. zzn3 TaxID=3039775 RepID=UPI0024363672|nr:AmmeMemoRadiSam system protein B [Thiomicrorhabdus sp. zzn3]MDG6777957.1 AmmeMemoRadiSam system protein B [Thiomicrorhabdus sp. zzn3]